MGILQIAIIILISLAGYSATSAAELRERQQITDTCTNHLRMGKFDQLEKLIERYRGSQERTTSGVWKLAVCYIGIQNEYTSPTDIFYADEWDRNYAILDRWREQVPESVAARLVEAMFMIDELKEIRYSRSHSRDPVAMVRIAAKRMKEARDYLLEMKNIAAHDPHWYVLMGQTGLYMGEARNNFFLRMEEGYDRHPKYLELYNIAVRFINANWPGDDALYEAIANSAQARTEASEGMALYARVYWVSYSHAHKLRLVSRSAPHWDKMKKGMDDVLKKYPDQWNIQNFAFFSCLARDRQKTKELIELSSILPVAQAWRNIDTYKFCRSYANDPA